jgi:DNA-binding NtrC family response regulator
MNALVVDDDLATRELLAEVLREIGLGVTTCDSGETGWATYISGDYDLILLDWVLPGIDGLELSRRIRSTPRGDQAIILIVTGKRGADSLSEVLESGANDYIAKPLDLDLLRVRLTIAARTARELQARERSLAGVRESERRLSEVAETLPVTLFALDARATCILARGSALQDCLGLESSPFGADFKALLRPHPRAAHTLQAALAGNVGECVINGVGRVVELRLAPVLDEDDERVVNGIAVDITERIRMLQTYERTVQHAERAAAAEQDADGAPGEAMRYRTETGECVGFRTLIGCSPPMFEVYDQIRDYAPVDWTVLVTGETGTGKELVARAIHDESPRSGRPFIAVNCAGLSVSLLQSQLFGHRRGAFTGATADQAGYFEAAHGGTLFLDEIGDIGPEIQMSLLRVLEEGEITRVGESHPRKVDVRVITATNRNLQADVDAGRFRADLMYRIRVARIMLPPLRERAADVPVLAEHFLGRARTMTGKAVEGFTEAAMTSMRDYAWPGNVRELRSAIEFAVMRTRGAWVERRDLPPELQGSTVASSVPLQLDTDERTRIRAALAQADGNRSRAARLLGISRATLYRRLSELGI